MKPIEIKNRKVLVDGKEKRLFGGEVEYFRLDPKNWKEILKRLIDAGMGWVSTYIPWQRHARTPDDVDFEGKRDPRLNARAYIELCGALGLSVYFRPGPLIVSEMTYGGLPTWVAEDPEIAVWDSKNIPQPGYRGGLSPSYLHPKYLDYVRRWFDKVDEAFAPYWGSNGGPIRLYQLDNEVSMICRDAFLQSDYNPFVVRRGGLWHRFLREKYQSPDKLPYRAKFRTFEEIEPPRELPHDVIKDLTYYFDWAEFKEWLMAEYLKVLRQLHEERGVKGVLFMTNLNPHRPITICHNWKRYEEAVNGIVGYDHYCRPFMAYYKYQWISRVARMMDEHCVMPWSAEYQAGNWSEDVKGDWGTNSAENHEFMALVGIGQGYKGLSWYMFHDRENWGFAPVSDLGHPRSQYFAIAKVMKLANGIEDLAGLEAVRDVAVMFYRPFAWLSHLVDPMPCREDGKIAMGEPFADGIEFGKVYKEFEGLASLLSQAGFNPGLVDPWWKPERLFNFRALFVPCHSFMDEETQRLLLRYVKGGGNLFIGPYIPEKNLAGKPARILASAFGKTKSSLFASSFSFKMGKLSACGYEVACGAPGRVIARAGSIPIVTMKEIGKGKVFFIGCLIAQAYPEREPPENIEFLKRILALAGVSPVVETNQRFVEAVVRKSAKEVLLFVYNVGKRAVRATLKFNGVRARALKDFWTGEELRVARGKVEVSLDVKSARVFRVIQSKQ